MMRALIVSCVFPPEPIVSARTSNQVAQELASQQCYVEVITSFPSRPAGRLYHGYKRRLYVTELSSDRYQITRCFSILSPESTTVSRFLETVHFGLTSGWAVLTRKRPDVIYANTWPVFAELVFCSSLRNFAVCPW